MARPRSARFPSKRRRTGAWSSKFRTRRRSLGSRLLRGSAPIRFPVYPVRRGRPRWSLQPQDRNMSEKDNVARVTKLYEAFTKGDIGYIIDQLTDDVRWVTHLDPVVPWAGTFPGKQGVPQFFESI